MTEIILLYVTASDEDEAARIGRSLVEEKLCACANVLGAVRSFYHWQGKLVDDTEAVLIAKTRAGLVDQAVERIKALHSYDLPCVAALPVGGGNMPFLDWVAEETGG